jgi:protein SCO1/2
MVMQRKVKARLACELLLVASLFAAAGGCRLGTPPLGSSREAGEGLRPERGSPIILRNQDDHSFEFRSLAGRALLVSFIYTRCPSPTMCPLVTRKFIRVQKELKEVRDRIRFLLITLDPEYDTPRVLKEYGEVSGADFTNLWFLTGERDSLDRLQRIFRVYKKEEQPGVYAHTTDVFLLDKEGNVRKAFPGAFWDVGEVVDAALDLLEVPQAERAGQLRRAE